MSVRKFFEASVVKDAGLGDRQVKVIANSGRSDRVKDILLASGCKLDNYRANNIVLADHDRSAPIGNFAPEIAGGAVAGVLTFAPAGMSAKADEYCALYKAGVMKSVSVGFNPIDYFENEKGGLTFTAWELLELSCVAVGCDPAAVVVQRAHRATAKSDPTRARLTERDQRLLDIAIAERRGTALESLVDSGADVTAQARAREVQRLRAGRWLQ